MKVTVKDGKGCEKILKVEIAEDRIRAEYQSFYKAIGPKAKVPGFRPGKIPQNILEMHYGGQARESVLKELITESYQQALREQSLAPLGYPEVGDVNFQETKLSYKATIEIRPRVKLGRVTGLKAKKEKIEIKNSELQDSLTRVQESMAQYKAVEDRAAAMGDYLIADYTTECDGKEIDKKTDDWFELSEEKEMLKGISKGLVGLKLEDKKEIKLILPEDYAQKEYAGKEATIKVSVKEIKTKSLPNLDNDFVQSLGGNFKTLEDLKERVKKDLQASKEKNAEVQFEKELIDELLKHNKLELPERLIKRRQEYLAHDALKHYQQQGIPEDSLKEMSQKLHDDFADEAKRQVHLAFLLDEIAIQQKISVDADDRKIKYEAVAAQIRQPVEDIEKYYSSNPERLESLNDQIRNEKAIEFIKKNAKEK